MDNFEIEVVKAREIIRKAKLPNDPQFEFSRSSGFLEVEGRRYPAGEVVTVTCMRRNVPEHVLWQQVYKSNRYFSWLFAFADDVRNGVVREEAELVVEA
jgi:hypothetical protein